MVDSVPTVGGRLLNCQVKRRRGCEQAIAEAELRPHHVDGPHVPPEPTAAAALIYLAAHPEVKAAFCCNDAVAVALIQEAQRSGLDVPGRLSVVGYDDIDLARYVTPQLTRWRSTSSGWAGWR